MRVLAQQLACTQVSTVQMVPRDCKFAATYTLSRCIRKASVGSNLEYDFARRVRTSTVLEGFTCAGERKYFGDDRLELSFIHERRDLIQLPAISVDNEKDSTGAVLITDTGRNRRN